MDYRSILIGDKIPHRVAVLVGVPVDFGDARIELASGPGTVYRVPPNSAITSSPNLADAAPNVVDATLDDPETYRMFDAPGVYVANLVGEGRRVTIVAFSAGSVAMKIGVSQTLVDLDLLQRLVCNESHVPVEVLIAQLEVPAALLPPYGLRGALAVQNAA